MVLLVFFHLPQGDTMQMKIFTLSLSTPFDDMYFFVYNNLRQLLLPTERKFYMSS